MKGEETINSSRIKELIKEYMSDCLIEGNSPASMENKAGAFNRLMAWLGERGFSPALVKEYIASLLARGLQPSSVATDARKYKSFANWMAKPERAYCSPNWPLLIKVPKVPDKRIDVPFMEAAKEALFAGTNVDKSNVHWRINQEGRDMGMLMLNTGLRIKEALFLDPEGFHLDNATPWLMVASKGKGGEKEELPLLPGAVEILKKSRTKDPRNKKEQYFGVSEDALNTMLERGCKKVGIAKITSHKLRHIFATELARSGMDPYRLQKLMRHSEFSITEKYYLHLRLEDLLKSLQMHHPLARKERTVEQITQRLRETIKELGIEGDSRFRIINEGNNTKIEVL